MAELTSETTFSIIASAEYFEEYEDLYLYPENAGSLALRELRYPGDILPPLFYESNPDRWENFDSVPMTNRPLVKAELTIASAQIVQWPGYYPDRPVREIWQGSDTKSRMTSNMLRRLYEYFAYPPISGYITWCPRDRTNQLYYIQVESLHVGGQDITSFDWVALFQGELVPFEVIFQFRIIGEVP
jgi:hypothetical protein